MLQVEQIQSIILTVQNIQTILIDSYCIIAFVSISMYYIVCYFNLNSIPIKFLF